MKAIFGIIWMLMSVSWAQVPAVVPVSPAAAGKNKEISAVVRIIRANPETEVFFKDYKDSLIIPKDSQHNKVFAACEESRKKGTAVKLVVDPVGHRILGLPEAAAAGAESSDMSAAGAAGSGSH